MEQMRYKCEVCYAVAHSEKQMRRQNWILISGGSANGISVWLEKPRKPGSYMLRVGFKERPYHFCGIDCLVKALKGKESI